MRIRLLDDVYIADQVAAIITLETRTLSHALFHIVNALIFTAHANKETGLSFQLALPFTNPITTEESIAWRQSDYQKGEDNNHTSLNG